MHLKSVLDPLGSVFSTLSTGLYVIASAWAWPVALVAIIANSCLYFLSGLYADMSKEFIFGCLTLYGWYEWLRGGPSQHALEITRISRQWIIRLFIIFLFLFFISYSILRFALHSNVPLWDSATTSLSLVAEWMTCRKLLENWLLWGLVDALYIGLYFHKGLPAHGIEMCAYLLVAAIGYWLWRRKMLRASRSHSSQVIQPGV